MIDLHSHIIYGVDDGSENADMSLELLRIAAKNGTTGIFATPHVIDLNNKPSWSLILERTAELQHMADAAGLAISVYTGAEAMISMGLLDAYKEAEHAYCLADSSYALVELPMHEVPLCADEFWYRMQLMGLNPVLAHPERCSALHSDTLLRWIRRGVLTQINGASLLGRFGLKAMDKAEIMLREGMVTFIGSDAHKVDVRNTDMSSAYRAVSKLIGEDKAHEIAVLNPKRLLADETIEM